MQAFSQMMASRGKKFRRWLFMRSGSESNLLALFAHRFFRICYALVRDIFQGALELHAMSLVYTTLLAIVPLLAISFYAFTYFNVQDYFAPILEQMLFPMGDKGHQIYQQIINAVSNVKVGLLGIVGALVLLYAVITLMHKVEQALNSIWCVTTSRAIMRRLLVYIGLALLGPLVLAALGAMVVDLGQIAYASEWWVASKSRLMLLGFISFEPYLLVIFVFLFIYKWVPNADVNFTSALLGACIAGLVWHLASWGFTAFVVNSARYQLVYSGFALAIVALLWLYTSWLILLLGSSVSFYFQHDNYIVNRLDDDTSAEMREGLAIEIMYRLTQAELEGRQVALIEIERLPNVPGVLIKKLMEHLLHYNYIRINERQAHIVLARPSSEILLSSLLQSIREEGGHKVADARRRIPIEKLLHFVQGQIEAQLGDASLRDLVTGGLDPKLSK
jgi:membrane protein